MSKAVQQINMMGKPIFLHFNENTRMFERHEFRAGGSHIEHHVDGDLRAQIEPEHCPDYVIAGAFECDYGKVAQMNAKRKVAQMNAKRK